MPERTCIGCRSRRPATDLLRLALDGDRVVVGRTVPGRGAWLCPDPGCATAALRSGAFARALRAAPGSAQLTELMAGWPPSSDLPGRSEADSRSAG